LAPPPTLTLNPALYPARPQQSPTNHPLPRNPHYGMSTLDFVLSVDRSGTESPDASCPPSDAGEVDDLLVRTPQISHSHPFLTPPKAKCFKPWAANLMFPTTTSLSSTDQPNVLPV